MSRIVISCANLTSGGAERVLSILSKPLVEQYDEVIYVMWVEGPVYYEIDSRVKLISIENESGSKNHILKMFWFRKFIKSICPDLVISFLTPYNMRVSLSLLGLNTKIVVAERNDPHLIPGGKVVACLRNLLYIKAKGILCQTKYAAAAFKGILYKKTHVIYNPVVMNGDLVSSALATPKENLIVSVARLVPQKDQKSLINAFYKFKQRHSDYRLIIYGEGPYRHILETYIKSLNLSDSVFLPGVEKHIWQKIKRAKLFVLSSKMEGMSNAMIEAMCLGLPVISTKVAGATDLIQDGKNGFLTEVADSNKIADLFALIVDNPDYAMTIGSNASHIYEDLKSDVIIPQWIKYINEFII